MDEKLAIVLTGGGARASYQAGALRALYEIIKKDQSLFDIITGNSAGAINAGFLASNARDWGSSTQYLVDLWKRVKPDDIYDISQLALGKIGTKFFRGTLFKSDDPSPVNGILDTSPLRKLLTREVDFGEIKHLIESKALWAVAISTTNYFSGASVVFFDGDQSIESWEKFDRMSIKTDLNVEHIMGSSAIPFFFQPIKIGPSYFGDGCIRQTTPLSPAINMGARKIISIGIRYQRSVDIMKEQTMRLNNIPPMSQVGGVVMNAIFLDSLDADVARLEKMNSISAMMGKHAPYINIPILNLKPSRDLGLMTEKLNKELPTMLRYLLRGIGVSGQSGLDLLSYLAFDSSYTMQVVELGYEDTMARKKEILAFIDR
jgi:NTE family protein